MRILFHMLPEIGHLNPTFPLARALAERGHEVLYTAVSDLKGSIEARGFACVPLHPEILPPGALNAIQEIPFDLEREHVLNCMRDRVHEEYFAGGSIEKLLRAVNPDLLIADVVSLSPLQFAAHALGIPCLPVCTSLSQQHNELPPLLSSLDGDTPQLLLEAARWESCCVRSFGDVPSTGIMTALIEWYCTRYAYPPEDISIRSVFWPALTQYREAVLCEEAFDLPRAASSPIYLATPVDLQRDEVVPDDVANFVGGCESLIYASLGSLPGRYAHGARFFRELIAAMRAEPHWRAVLATGALTDTELATPLPDNVLLVRRAPQIWLLRRAAVFVTHAGLGGVREAIALEVPMVAVPQLHDQPGNATRIVHHGIGLSISADVVTARGLQRAIRQIFGSREEFRARIRVLAQACRAEVASGRAVMAVETAARDANQQRNTDEPVAERGEPATQGWAFVGGVAGFQILRREIAAGSSRGLRASEQLTTALEFAGGPLLARIEMDTTSGRSRCLWFFQAEDLLFEYAAWCAEQALAASAKDDPHAAAAFDEGLRRMQHLRDRRAPFVEQEAHAQRFVAASMQLWHEGHAAAGGAYAMQPVDAAYEAQSMALRALARREAGESAGTRQGSATYERRYQVERARFGAELERRVAARASELGIGWLPA